MNGISQGLKHASGWEQLACDTGHLRINEEVYRAGIHTLTQVVELICAFCAVSSCVFASSAVWVALEAGDEVPDV